MSKLFLMRSIERVAIDVLATAIGVSTTLRYCTAVDCGRIAGGFCWPKMKNGRAEMVRGAGYLGGVSLFCLTSYFCLRSVGINIKFANLSRSKLTLHLSILQSLPTKS